MRVLVVGDLHLDSWDHAKRDPFSAALPVIATIDAMIIAGDLTNNPDRNWSGALARIGKLIPPAKIFVLPGNHDYYGANLKYDKNLRLIAERHGVNFIQKSSFVLGGVRFLGCTLWSDFHLHGETEVSMTVAGRAMNDYVQIRRSAIDSRPITPVDTLEVHRDHLDWLKGELAVPFAGRTVVVTHHCPSPTAIGADNRLAPAFCSDLSGLIIERNPDLWLFGHTHRRLSSRVGNTPVVNTSLGYAREVPDSQIPDCLLRGLIDTDTDVLLDDPT